jgi:hypothetical protein
LTIGIGLLIYFAKGVFNDPENQVKAGHVGGSPARESGILVHSRIPERAE